MKKNRLMLLVLVVLAVALMTGGTAALSAPAKPFNNVKITVFGDAGHNLKPFDWYKDNIKNEFGIIIDEVVGVPFTSVYEKLKTEFIGQTGAYDLVIFYPAFLGEFAGLGYLTQLDTYAKKYDPKLDDISTGVRELNCKYGGKLYALPYDGDVLNLYYRKDLFVNATEKANFKKQFGYELKVPDTWDQFNDIAKFFTRKKGETLAGQALKEDFYGSAELAARGFSYAWWLARFGSLGGVYFDENMKPMINTDKGVKALDLMKTSIKYSPPDVMAYGYEELKNAYLDGKVAMMVQWSDVQKKAQDPAESKIVNKSGIALMPGIKTGDKIVRSAPMPVGRVLAVPKSARNPEAAYAVARYLSVETSLHDVSTSETGLDPYRKSHVANPKAFAALLGTEEAAKDYLAVVGENLENAFPEINLPGAGNYQDVLDLYINKALSGEMSSKAALDAAAKEWEQITKKLGAEKQKELYQKTVETWKALGIW
ncbi:MAG: extracellular solute-binding protein [Clostridia bacterium]|nr:extracellular solute-binding protein [Clostridia bacterium]